MEDQQQFRFGIGKPDDILTIVQAAVDKKEKEKDVHWTIKVFGGALVSVVAVVVIGTFQTAFQSIGECQKSLQTVVTKDEFNLRTKSLWDSVRDFNAQKTEIAAIKERVRLLEQQNRDLQIDLQKLRDRIPNPAPVQQPPAQKCVRTEP